MVRILAVRDFKLRYRQTAIGVVGVVISPLLGAGVLSFVFGSIAGLPSEGVPYVAFAYAGSLGWNVFASILGRASGALLGDVNLVSRIYVPRILLPIAGLVIALLDFVVASSIMVVLMVAFGIIPGWSLLTLPFWMLSMAALALGIGCILAVGVVHYRDVGTATSLGLQLLQYLTPVAYSITAVPDRFRGLYELNPMATIVSGFRWAILDTGAPTPGKAGVAGCVCVAVFVAGVLVFNRLERGLADVI